MPAIGKDLSKIRSHLGLSIQDIQHYTKIPVSTLKTIENGSIFDHPEENQTYIRSFVRSYGRALKIDDDIMIKALDQNEVGNYNHLLLEEYPDLHPDKKAIQDPLPNDGKQVEAEKEPNHSEQERSDKESTEQEEKSGSPEVKHIEIEDEPSEETEVDSHPSKTPSETESEDVTPKSTETERSVKSVDWADVGRKFNQEKKRTPVWVIGIIIIIIIALVVGYFLYQNGFLDIQTYLQDDQEQVSQSTETSQSSLSLDLSDSLSASDENNETESEGVMTEPAAELEDTLELTVYAAYDGLGPVRVWSDIKPRMDPYWLEEGTAMEFEFRDTIRIRGSYPNLLLFKDGHLIQNAEQEYLQQNEDYIELTRNFFLSDPKWATSVDFELPENVPPPDSIAIRPTF